MKFRPVMPDDPGDNIEQLGYRGIGCNAPILPIKGIHFLEGESIPMHHRATSKWHIGNRILLSEDMPNLKTYHRF